MTQIIADYADGGISQMVGNVYSPKPYTQDPKRPVKTITDGTDNRGFRGWRDFAYGARLYIHLNPTPYTLNPKLEIYQPGKRALWL